MNYWLFKSEPGCYSWQDLEAAPGQTTSWDGVRNYQARNFMKAMKKRRPGLFLSQRCRPLHRGRGGSGARGVSRPYGTGP